jgi:hypothetical protein
MAGEGIEKIIQCIMGNTPGQQESGGAGQCEKRSGP